jgi:uncharacterized protein (UPF0264 family)
LLVSVRSAVEAQAAMAGGASIIDMKEPSRGSLGRADATTWQAVRAVVRQSMPLSVALGELNDWIHLKPPQIPEDAWSGVDFCKLGLAGAPPDWLARWSRLRRELSEHATPFPGWVAVVYLDWELARAPHPDAIIDAAVTMPECRAVLFDTWSKSNGMRLTESWKPRVERVQNSRRLVALAGSLDAAAIFEWKAWQPDIFAVRGAACFGGDRLQPIEAARVARLVAALDCNIESAELPIDSLAVQISNRTP